MKRQTKLQTAARRMTALTGIGGLMKRRLMMVLVMVGVSFGFALFGAQSASAATLTVTKTADTGDGVCDADCSLREAIAQAAAGDTVVFAAPLFDTPQIININGQLLINKNLTVTGRAANLLTIRNVAAASLTSCVFRINGAFTVQLSGMTVTGGNVTNGGGGSGGGIFSNGNLTLTNVHVAGNTTDGFGGGISNDGGTLNVISSTVSNNTANTGGGTGGGIDSLGTLTVTNSTISGNRVPNGNGNGGGIFSGNSSFGSNSATITNSTITDNEAAGGANSAGGVIRFGVTVTVRNTIIAANRNNATTPDVNGIGIFAFASQGYNLIGNVGAVTNFNQTGDQTGTSGAGNQLDPRLLPLALNGATTPTHALLSDSPALDKGNCFGCSLDQRRQTRPVDLPVPNAADGADIGAFEVQMSPTAASVSVSGRVLVGKRGLLNATVTLTDSNGATRTARTTAFGYYRFDEVGVGQTYIVSVQSKRFQFAPQVVNVSEELSELNFYANSESLR